MSSATAMRDTTNLTDVSHGCGPVSIFYSLFCFGQQDPVQESDVPHRRASFTLSKSWRAAADEVRTTNNVACVVRWEAFECGVSACIVT